MDKPINHQWLPMPSGISLTHKSFANDLLEHFDIDRTGLDWSSNSSDEELGSIKSPSTYSMHNNSIKEPESLPHNIPSTSRQQKAPKHNNNNNNNNSNNNNDNNNLLRKSSAYLFKRYESGKSIEPERSSLFHSLTLRRKKNFYHRPAAKDVFSESSTSLPPAFSKVAVQTTIHIPHTRHSYHQYTAVQPPIITNYPPKPLRYSPVEPLPEQELSAKKKILHRISLPLLRLTHHEDPSSPEIKRRRSDSEVYRSKENLLSTFGKRWNKLLFSCGIKKSPQ